MTVAIPGAGTRQPAGSAPIRALLRSLYRLVGASPASSLLRLPLVESARRRLTAKCMTAADVVEVVTGLDGEGVAVWLAGGWALDALLGEQTREHGDLDVVVRLQDTARAVAALERQGFVPAGSWEAPFLNFTVQLDDFRRLRSVGVHPVAIDDEGPATWRATMRSTMRACGIDSAELFAMGTIAGHEVQCLSAGVQLALHTGYDPRERDHHDVRLLCSRFSLAAPPGYENPHDVD